MKGILDVEGKLYYSPAAIIRMIREAMKVNQQMRHVAKMVQEAKRSTDAGRKANEVTEAKIANGKKPRRKRRTKAEMEAARALEAKSRSLAATTNGHGE